VSSDIPILRSLLSCPFKSGPSIIIVIIVTIIVFWWESGERHFWMWLSSVAELKARSLVSRANKKESGGKGGRKRGDWVRSRIRARFFVDGGNI
jgi:hypothetical protein